MNKQRALGVQACMLLMAACRDDDSSRTSAPYTTAPFDGGTHTSQAAADGGSHTHASGDGGGHSSCTAPYPKDPRDDTMSGELVRVVTGDNGTPDDPSDDPYELLLPREMLDWNQPDTDNTLLALSWIKR